MHASLHGPAHNHQSTPTVPRMYVRAAPHSLEKRAPAPVDVPKGGVGARGGAGVIGAARGKAPGGGSQVHIGEQDLGRVAAAGVEMKGDRAD